MTSTLGDRIDFVLCDLDGVVWLAHEALPGAADAIARLRASGRRVLFVTNNSMSTMADQTDALASVGIDGSGDVVSSAQAAASLVGPADRVLVCGGAGVVEAVSERGATVVDHGPTDAVIVGLHRHFDYDGLTRASTAIRDGATFIATNDDATYPTPAGPVPGGGALVAAVATAAGCEPTVAGKPHQAMADLVAERCGASFAAANSIVIGDRWSTDGAFAGRVGCRFALVRTGVTAPGAAAGGPVDIDAPSLAAVADTLVR